MLAPDLLSLVFLGCAVFAGGFLVVTTALGHGPHVGHVGHLGHLGHLGHAGHVGHAGAPVHGSHVGHAGHGGGTGTQGEAAVSAQPGAWDSLTHTLEGTLNVYGAVTFLLIFGVLGFLLHTVGAVGSALSLLLALVLGFASAVGVSALLTRIFLASGGGSELTSESSRLEGRLAQVSIPIRGGGIGEVIYTGSAGGRQSVGARSVDGQTIPVGAEVVVLGYRDGIASVQPWDTFMASVRAGNAPELEPIEGQS